jgi:hypothetical protein
MDSALPPEPFAGQPLQASWGAAVIRWCRSNRLVQTPGMLLSRTPNGTSFRPQATPAPAAAAPILFPWQCYASPWQGDGADPYGPADGSPAGDGTRVMRFRVALGAVGGRFPTNISSEFVAFGDPTDSEIEMEDAVVTTYYLNIPVAESGETGSGNIVISRPTIMLYEGDDLGDGGISTPPSGDDGSIPAYIIVALGQLQWWGGVLRFAPAVSSYLQVFFNSAGTFGSTARTPVCSNMDSATNIINTIYYAPSSGSGGGGS